MPSGSLVHRIRTSGAARVWTLNVAITAAALVVYVALLQDLRPAHLPFHIPWPVLAGMFWLAEIFVVHIHLRREAHSFSLSELPLILGLFFATPTELLLAQATGSFIALAFTRHQPPMKMAFNLSHFALEAGVAAAIFHHVTDLRSIEAGDWAAAFAVSLLVSIVGSVMITAAISLAEGKAQFQTLPQGLGFGTVVCLANSCLALLTVRLLSQSARMEIAFLVVPLVTTFFAIRAYTAQRQKHESLVTLYEATRVVPGSLRMEKALADLLANAREMFRADMAEVLLFPLSDEEVGWSATLGPGEKVEPLKPVELDPSDGVWARVSAEQEAILFSGPIENPRLAAYFARRGVMDAMVAPLSTESGIAGTLMVGGRLGDTGTFTADDLTMLDTLANHASVALENARLVARLEESLAHLTEMNQLKDDFVASVSHELRTPLTSIQGFVKTLLREDASFPPEQEREFLLSIERQSTKLHRLVEDLLAVAQIESDRVRPIVTKVTPDRLAAEVVEDLGDRTSGHSIALSFDELPPIETDGGKVHQILSNLVENAVKYSPAGTTITVSGHESATGITISVEDEGPGIPAELQEKIFERFYQVDQSIRRAVGGAGLGLYICRKLAESIGGRVWLERSSEAGSTFGIWLPWVPAGAMVPERPALVVHDGDAA